MAASVAFSPKAWDEYLRWHEEDRSVFEKINTLINDCRRDPFRGLGKPEGLKGNHAGSWSRRISDEHRFVYRIYGKASEQTIAVIQCRYHYDK